MVYYTSDPRKKIREYIGEKKDLFNTGNDIYCINVKDDNDNYYNIPIYLTEESKSNVIPSLPFIELGLLSNTSEPHDIGANTRKNETIIDVNIYWTTQDNVDSADFGKLIADKFYDLIRSNQCIILGVNTFINVNNTSRVLIETYGKQVVYHRNMEIYVLWYDKP